MKEGWEYCQLEAAVKKGSSNISLNKIKGEDGEYPVFAAKGFVQNVSFYHQEEDYLAIIKDGAGIGRVSKHPAKSSVVGTMQYLIPKSGFDLDFVKYFLEGIDFEKHRNGSTIPHIYFKDYKSEKFPKIPLPEQQRIVTILDKAFAAIDKAKANAEQNLQNAKELFESYLQGVFENGDWDTKSIEAVCDEIFAGGDAPKDNYSKEPNEKHNIPIYANAVKDRGLYGYTDFARVTKPCVTIAARGSGTGHTELRNEQFLPIVRLIVCIPNSELISTEFLKYTIDNLVIQRSGSAIPQLTVPMIKDYQIPVPSVGEQKQLIEQAETLRAETLKLEAVYQKKMNDLEELKKSILQKAFAGELTSSVSTTKPITKVIPLQKVDGISPTDLQAGITALALQKHIEQNQQHSFHHVKAEKIVHLSEYILNIDLNRNPVKDAAGPNDFPHAKKVESRARKAGFYSVYKNGDYYDYRQGNSLNKVIQKAQNSLGEKAETLSQIIDILAPMSTQHAEVVATVYAAWNNLLLTKKMFSDEDIVTEARENWHENKLAIERDKFFSTLKWMRKHELLLPKGNGKVVETKLTKNK